MPSRTFSSSSGNVRQELVVPLRLPGDPLVGQGVTLRLGVVVVEVDDRDGREPGCAGCGRVPCPAADQCPSRAGPGWGLSSRTSSRRARASLDPPPRCAGVVGHRLEAIDRHHLDRKACNGERPREPTPLVASSPTRRREYALLQEP